MIAAQMIWKYSIGATTIARAVRKAAITNTDPATSVAPLKAVTARSGNGIGRQTKASTKARTSYWPSMGQIIRTMVRSVPPVLRSIP